jgi:hypothetical protein
MLFKSRARKSIYRKINCDRNIKTKNPTLLLGLTIFGLIQLQNRHKGLFWGF